MRELTFQQNEWNRSIKLYYEKHILRPRFNELAVTQHIVPFYYENGSALEMKERKIQYYSVDDGIQIFLPCLSFYNDDDVDYGDDLRFELLMMMMMFTFIWKPLYRYFPLHLFLFQIHSISNVFVHSSCFVLALNNGYYIRLLTTTNASSS